MSAVTGDSSSADTGSTIAPAGADATGAGLPSFERDLVHCAMGGLLTYVAWTMQGKLPFMRPIAITSSTAAESEPSPTALSAPSTVAPETSPVEPAASPAAAAAHGLLQRLRTAVSSAVRAPRLTIDASTRRALELTRPYNGRRRARGSLLHAIDKCNTAGGSRLIDERLCSPLACDKSITQRLASVDHFIRHEGVREVVRAALSHVPDLERCLQRVTLGRATARDLSLVRDGLAAAQRVGLLLATGDHVAYNIAAKGRTGAVARVAVPTFGTEAVPCSDDKRRAAVDLLAAALLAGAVPKASAAPPAAAVAAFADAIDHQQTSAAFCQHAAAAGFDAAMPPAASNPLPLPLAMAALTCLQRLKRVDKSERSGLTAAAGPEESIFDAFAHLDAALPSAPQLHTAQPPLGQTEPAFAPVGTASDDVPVGTALVDAGSSGLGSSNTSGSGGVSGGFNPSSGDVIAPGYDAELDAARRLRDDASASLAALQEQLRSATGVRALKLRRTDEYGCTADVPIGAVPLLERFVNAGGAGGPRSRGGKQAAAAKSALPAASPVDPTVASALESGLAPFSVVKSLKNTVRCKCPALAQLDHDLYDASARAAAIQDRILGELTARVASCAPTISAVARALAVVDVTAALADLAADGGLCKPTVLPWPAAEANSTTPPPFTLQEGRHLVVERALLEGWAARAGSVALDERIASAAAGAGTGRVDSDDYEDRTLPAPEGRAFTRAFTANDVVLGGGAAPHVALICGPNMGGKSTILRLAAQAVVLSHMGSFVPARSLTLGTVDRVFARVGASDDVTRDKSTFLVEMEETAAILSHATCKSFVIVDEVGRGTSLTDGLALAWAVLEHLMHEARVRTLFATHIHELTAIAFGANAEPDALTTAAAPVADAPPPIQCLALSVEHDADGAPVLTHKLVEHPVCSLLPASARAWRREVGLPDAAASDTTAGDDSPGGNSSSAVWKRITAMSYGVHVAAKAGLPPHVLQRARFILSHLDASRAADAWANAVSSMPPARAGAVSNVPVMQ